MENLNVDYQGFRIKIVPRFYNGEKVHYIIVNDRVLSFVADKDYALSIATRYVDVTLDEYHSKSTKSRKINRKEVPRSVRQGSA